MAEPISADERKAILEREVAREVKAGWRVVSQTDSTAQLVRDKRPSCLLTIILLCLIILPGLLYWFLYKGEEGLFIQVDHYGRVTKTHR